MLIKRLIFRQALTEYPEARKALEKQARDRSVTLQLTAASSRRANRVLRDTSPLDPIGTCTLSSEQLLEWFVYSHRMKTALISKFCRSLVSNNIWPPFSQSDCTVHCVSLQELQQLSNKHNFRFRFAMMIRFPLCVCICK